MPRNANAVIKQIKSAGFLVETESQPGGVLIAAISADATPDSPTRIIQVDSTGPRARYRAARQLASMIGLPVH